MNKFFCAVAAGLAAVSSVFGAEIVFQNGTNGYEGGDGVMIKGEPPEYARKNFYGSPEWEVEGVSWGGPRRLLLIRFSDITGPEPGRIPEGAVIHSARLELFKRRSVEDAGQYGAPGDAKIYAYLLLTPFFPATSTFEERSGEQPEEQYWGNRNSIEQGPVSEVDFNPADRSEAVLSPEDNSAWMSWDVTKMVAEWVERPETNYGLMLQTSAYWIGATFASTHFEDAELWPRLVVEYSE